MRKSILVVVLFLVVSTAISGACAPALTPSPTPAPAPTPVPTPAPAAPINWKLAGIVPKEHWIGRAKLWWIEEVDKRTNGRLKIEYVPGGALAKNTTESLQLTDKGVVQAGDTSTASVMGVEVPGIDVHSLPRLIPADWDLRKKINRELLPSFKKLIEGKYSVYVQSVMQAEPRDLYTKKKVTRLGDLKGLKVYSAGAQETSFYKTLGGTPTNLSFTEMYAALQQGVLDAAGFADSGVVSFKLFEVVKYIIPLGYDGIMQTVVVNKAAFDALPKDIQQILITLQPELQEKTQDIQIPDIAATRKSLIDKGMEIVTWPKEDLAEIDRLAKAVWQEWLAGAGPAGKELLDKVQSLVK